MFAVIKMELSGKTVYGPVLKLSLIHISEPTRQAESCVVFNTGPYTDLPDNSISITANMQSETGFPSSHQLKCYVASKSRMKLAARAVLSADSGLLVLSLYG